MTADELSEMGKQAAAMAESCSLNLTEAVARTIGMTKLNTEQVRRVVEFANHEAFHQKHSSLHMANRVVDIEGGPADPQSVLQSLNNAARPTSEKVASLDYALPPMRKTSSSSDYGMSVVASTHGGVRLRLNGLRHKLASAHETVVQDAASARYQMLETMGELQVVVKRAALNGMSTDDLVSAWARVNPDLVGTCLEYMPYLPPQTPGVKVAHRVNPDHAMVRLYSQFVKHAQDFAQSTKARQNIEVELGRVETFLNERVSA